MKNKPVPRPRKSANKEQNQLDNLKEVKLSELRAREAKLRKAEERLKIKEKSIDELKNAKIMLETRCQHLEARYFELEQTLKLLQ
jgi:fibrillarin-like rRNA methylase